MNPSVSSRVEALRRQGLVESAFAVTSALLLVGSTGSPGWIVLLGALSIAMALRGRSLFEHAVPLADTERRELERLAAASPPVRELLDTLARAGQQPVRLDLLRCRRLARVQSMLDDRT